MCKGGGSSGGGIAHEVVVGVLPPEVVGVLPMPLTIACEWGHLDCVKLLSSFGVSRGADRSLEELAQVEGHAEVFSWLQLTALWTPLHHLEQLEHTPRQIRNLLRSGADLHAKPTSSVPSPFERAQALAMTGAGSMLLRAAAPWSPANHELFPEPTRMCACMLARLGYLLAASPQFEGEARALVDIWLCHVMPQALSR